MKRSEERMQKSSWDTWEEKVLWKSSSLLGTEQGNSRGKINLTDPGKEETSGVAERGPKLQHLGPNRQSNCFFLMFSTDVFLMFSIKHPKELNALWPACSSLWKHKPLLWLTEHLPVKDASGTASCHTTAKCSHTFTSKTRDTPQCAPGTQHAFWQMQPNFYMLLSSPITASGLWTEAEMRRGWLLRGLPDEAISILERF